MFEIIFYKDKNGNSELLDYMKELQKNRNNKESRIRSKKITTYIDLLQKNGLTLGEPYIKLLQKDIWELRPQKDRILFVYWNGNCFLLLSHFTKKTRKTPKSEIEKARNFLRDYMEREEIGNERTNLE